MVESRSAADRAALNRAVGMIDLWFESMRSPDGYGGPVVHWWRDSLVYCGAGHDWRYEGIIDGYLTLYARLGSADYLNKAKRAGDDLVRAQLSDGTYANSSFELNPRPGGTPHEAAADVGLLKLARVLRDRADSEWERYLAASERNIQSLLFGRLWREDQSRFGDGDEWFVPNKAATAIEAVCLLAELTGKEEYLSRYVRPTAEAILAHQVLDSGSRLHGAIAQASIRSRRVQKYFPYYAARSIPGLCAAYSVIGEERYLAGAVHAGEFLLRWRDDDGALPQVIYPAGRINVYPRWVAGAGDVVTALDCMSRHGVAADPSPTLDWLMAGQLESGAFRSAEGFSSQVSQRPPDGPPDARDVLPVVGWNDKAFRALATRATNPAHHEPRSVELDCQWFGERVAYREDGAAVTVASKQIQLYRWQKGQPWAEWMRRG